MNNDGVVVTCGSSGCAAERTVVVNGSHLTGTVDFDGDSIKIWDHTVSTGDGGVTVTGTGASRVASGTVIVQRNLIHEVSTTTFNSVGYGDPGCCFPTSGTVTSTFNAGPDTGKAESIAFSGTCGEATLTKTSGVREPLTLIHCL